MTEAVLVLPLFLLCLIAITDIARYMQSKSQFQNAAEHALGVASVIPGLDEQDESTVLEYTPVLPDDPGAVSIGPRGPANFNKAIETILKRIDYDLGSTLHQGRLDFNNGSYYLTPITAEAGVPNPVRILIPEPSNGQSLKDAMVERPIQVVVEGKFRPLLLSAFGGDISMRGAASGYRETPQKPAMPIALDCAGEPLFSDPANPAETRTCACLNDPDALRAEWKQYNSETGGCVCAAGLVNINNRSTTKDSLGRETVLPNEVCGCPNGTNFQPSWNDATHTSVSCNSCLADLSGVGSYLEQECRFIDCGGTTGQQGEPAAVSSAPTGSATVHNISSYAEACSCTGLTSTGGNDPFCPNGTPQVVASNQVGDDGKVSATCRCDCATATTGMIYSPASSSCACPDHKDLVGEVCECNQEQLVAACTALNAVADIPNCECLSECPTGQVVDAQASACVCPDIELASTCNANGGTWSSVACSCTCPSTVRPGAQWVGGASGPSPSCEWECKTNRYQTAFKQCLCNNQGDDAVAMPTNGNAWEYNDDANVCEWQCPTATVDGNCCPPLPANASWKGGSANASCESECLPTHQTNGVGVCECKNASSEGASCTTNGGTWNPQTCSCTCPSLLDSNARYAEGTKTCEKVCVDNYKMKNGNCECQTQELLDDIVASGDTKTVFYKYSMTCYQDLCAGSRVRNELVDPYVYSIFDQPGFYSFLCGTDHRNLNCESIYCVCPDQAAKTACKGTWAEGTCSCSCPPAPIAGAQWSGGSRNASCDWECDANHTQIGSSCVCNAVVNPYTGQGSDWQFNGQAGVCKWECPRATVNDNCCPELPAGARWAGGSANASCDWECDENHTESGGSCVCNAIANPYTGHGTDWEFNDQAGVCQWQCPIQAVNGNCCHALPSGAQWTGGSPNANCESDCTVVNGIPLARSDGSSACYCPSSDPNKLSEWSSAKGISIDPNKKYTWDSFTCGYGSTCKSGFTACASSCLSTPLTDTQYIDTSTCTIKSCGACEKWNGTACVTNSTTCSSDQYFDKAKCACSTCASGTSRVDATKETQASACMCDSTSQYTCTNGNCKNKSDRLTNQWFRAGGATTACEFVNCSDTNMTVASPYTSVGDCRCPAGDQKCVGKCYTCSAPGDYFITDTCTCASCPNGKVPSPTVVASGSTDPCSCPTGATTCDNGTCVKPEEKGCLANEYFDLKTCLCTQCRGKSKVSNPAKTGSGACDICNDTDLNCGFGETNNGAACSGCVCKAGYDKGNKGEPDVPSAEGTCFPTTLECWLPNIFCYGYSPDGSVLWEEPE